MVGGDANELGDVGGSNVDDRPFSRGGTGRAVAVHAEG